VADSPESDSADPRLLELLGHEELQKWLDQLERYRRNLAEETGAFSGEHQRVDCECLQGNFLKEKCLYRDMRFYRRNP